MGVSLRVSPTPGQAHSSSPLSQSDEECLANSILRQTACTDTSQTAPWSIYPTGNWGVENTMGEAVCSRAGKRALRLLPVTAYLGGEAVGEWRAWSGSWESRCWMQTYILATISNAPTSFAEWNCYKDPTVEMSCSEPNIIVCRHFFQCLLLFDL